VLGAALIVAVVAVAMGGLHVGAAIVARHRAQAAADLAALAAASRLPAGGAAACSEAAAVGTAMGASLHECHVDRLDVVVTVTVGTGKLFRADAHASARAGPLA